MKIQLSEGLVETPTTYAYVSFETSEAMNAAINTLNKKEVEPGFAISVLQHDIPNVDEEEHPEEFQTSAASESETQTKGYAEGNLHVKPLPAYVITFLNKIGH